MKIYQDISISDKTTIGLGNKVKYFVELFNKNDIYTIFDLLKKEQLKYFILGEGSNVIGSDEFLDIAILHPVNSSITFILNNEKFYFEFPTAIEYKEYYDIKIQQDLLSKIIYGKNKGNYLTIIADAGINWDYFVFFCTVHGIQAFYALSGIPGTMGATPIQNVGAYGEEVKNYIESVEFFYINDDYTLRENRFSHHECKFEYRNSIFKTYLNRFLLDKVIFKILLNHEIEIKYKEVLETLSNQSIELCLEEKTFFDQIVDESQKKHVIDIYRLRKCIYTIRRKKGMILDKNFYSKSVGSFFINPVLSEEEFKRLQNQIKMKHSEMIPYFKENHTYKVPAAWLIEYSGFYKGFKDETLNIGISPYHSLAIINYNGTVEGLKQFVKHIQEVVFLKTGISLKPEPVFMDQFINKY